MASGQGLRGIELKTTKKGFHYMNPIYPLTSLDQNTSICSHVNVHNSNSGEEMAFQFSNTRLADHNLLRALKPPVEYSLCKEPKDFRYNQTSESVAQVCKPLNATNMQVTALVSEKENVEAGSARTQLRFTSSKGKASNAQPKSRAGLLSFTDARRLQEGFDAASQPLSQVELNILDGAGGGLHVTTGESPSKNHGGLQAASSQGSQSLLSQRKHLNHNQEGLVCSQDCHQIFIPQSLTVKVQERTNETSNGLPQSAAPLKSTHLNTNESMEVPLLSQFSDRSELEILCDEVVQDNPFFLSQSCETWGQHPQNEKALLDPTKTQSIEKCSREYTHTCEEYNKDHVVVFFSVEKFLEENAARVNRQKLSKLSSLCASYSRKILCWVTSTCREQTFANYLLRLRRVFSSSQKGFVNLSSQRLPEFSPAIPSPSSKRQLAKDNELRAVLLKINDVFTSMETNLSDSMQERNR